MTAAWPRDSSSYSPDCGGALGGPRGSERHRDPDWEVRAALSRAALADPRPLEAPEALTRRLIGNSGRSARRASRAAPDCRALRRAAGRRRGRRASRGRPWRGPRRYHPRAARSTCRAGRGRYAALRPAPVRGSASRNPWWSCARGVSMLEVIVSEATRTAALRRLDVMPYALDLGGRPHVASRELRRRSRAVVGVSHAMSEATSEREDDRQILPSEPSAADAGRSGSIVQPLLDRPGLPNLAQSRGTRIQPPRGARIRVLPAPERFSGSLEDRASR
jgi:hypothetical protein